MLQTASAPGFRSPESKRKLTRLTWVLAGLIGLLQVIVPILLIGWALVEAFVGIFTIARPGIEAPAVVGEHIWYAREASADPEQPDATPMRQLLRVPVGSNSTPEVMSEFGEELGEPMLLTGETKLWAIHPRAVTVYAGGQTTEFALPDSLPSDAWPVLVDNEPAIVSVSRGYDDDALTVTLAKFRDNAWATQWQLSGPIGFDPNTLRAVQIDHTLHLFVDEDDGRVHHARYSAGKLSTWTRTKVRSDDWTATTLDGDPILVEIDDSREVDRVVAWRGSGRHNKSWKKFAEFDTVAASHIGAAALSNGDTVVLINGLYDEVEIWQLDANGVVASHTHATSSQMQDIIGKIVLSQFAPFILTGLLALLLTGSMRTHRVTEHLTEHLMASYASLARRGIAKAVDTVLASAVPVGLLVRQWSENSALPNELEVVVLFVVFGIPLFLLFSAMEGKWGQTPGKRLVSIRVVNMDLQPCGFGPAILRNLLSTVDGFFGCLVGVVAVATGTDWQRIGDSVAKTLVVQGPVTPREDMPS